jgi:hypothetical protein
VSLLVALVSPAAYTQNGAGFDGRYLVVKKST